ncbi:MAG: hypothetical protein JST26_03025 [Bacteroidetes bacterium]|nr:hypothetical protein [Bacteroidota bacterium]
MKRVFITIGFVCAVTWVIGCKKKDNSAPADDNPVSTTGGNNGGNNTTSFKWQENGGTVNTADSAYWSFGPAWTGLKAFKGGYANYFEINWAGGNMSAAGTYTLNSGQFTYLSGASTYTNPAAQNLHIATSATTAASPTFAIISGDFNVNVAGGTVSTITGTFTGLNHKY